MRLTGDELRAYFVLPQAGSLRIFGASRASLAEPFANLAELNSTINRGNDTSAPFVSDDGLQFSFSVANTVWGTSRLELAQPFGEPTVKREASLSEVTARDASMVAYAHRERYPPGIGNFHWITRAIPEGAADTMIALDALPTWYEPLSKQLWVLQGDVASIWKYDGSWQQLTNNTPFRVTWTAPSGCRLYGIVDGHPAMRSRVSSP